MLFRVRNLVLLAGVLHVLAGLAIRNVAGADVPLRNSGYVLAHSLAFFFCLTAARDYPQGSLLRRAWLLLSGESFCMGVRSLLVLGFLPAEMVARSVGIVLISLGSLCTIGGMLATGIALHRMGFSLRLHRTDIAWMLILAVALPATLALRYGWPIHLPLTSATTITVFLTAIVSIPLLRFSLQMGNALLARVNVCIVVYMTARCVYHVLTAIGSSSDAVELPRYFIGYAAAWVFAYAAALRYDAIRQAHSRRLRLSDRRATAATTIEDAWS